MREEVAVSRNVRPAAANSAGSGVSEGGTRRDAGSRSVRDVAEASRGQRAEGVCVVARRWSGRGQWMRCGLANAWSTKRLGARERQHDLTHGPVSERTLWTKAAGTTLDPQNTPPAMRIGRGNYPLAPNSCSEVGVV